ncbi:MAG: glycosyltransferase, partial [Oceanidesulfovibrio sp.]
ISQEEGREYGEDMVWTWSPWLQIYVSAFAQWIGGSNTWAGRLPFALVAILVLALAYMTFRWYFPEPEDRWLALLAVLFLALCIPYILFMRQNRYYSLGTLLTLTSLPAFVSRRPTTLHGLVAGLSLGLMFHANYLLLFSFGPAVFGAKLLLDRRLPPFRVLVAMAVSGALLIIPGFAIYGIGKQGGLLDFTRIPSNTEEYFYHVAQFMVPLPLLAAFAWRFRKSFSFRRPQFDDRREWWAAFFFIVIIVNVAMLTLIPQRFFRYIVHLFPLVCFLFSWAVIRLWSWQRLAGGLLAFLLLFTNWLYIQPMDWLGISNRPWHTDTRMLTYTNVPIALYLTELVNGYPDVNEYIIDFFQENAEEGDSILITYGDLPLQFYTDFKIMGGLQKENPEFLADPDWVLKRNVSRTKRDGSLVYSDYVVLHELDLENDYEEIILDHPDEEFGNRPDPYYHRFIPYGEPYEPLVVFKRKKPLEDAQ